MQVIYFYLLFGFDFGLVCATGYLAAFHSCKQIHCDFLSTVTPEVL